MIVAAVHVVLLLGMPPLLLGIITKTKALFAGRTGPPILQPYHDLIRLARKSMVTGIGTTWFFPLGPAVVLVTAILAGLLTPMGPTPAPIRFSGDLLVLVGLLAAGRLALTLAAMDTGSSLEGMGAAREVTFAALTEPALLCALLVFARESNTTNLSGLFSGGLAMLAPVPAAAMLLAASALFIVLLAENCRLPFDDPATHLELTMIHEVIVLDHSGPALGMAVYGGSIKLYIFGALLVGALAPLPSGPAALTVPLFVAFLILLAGLVGMLESLMARLRLVHVPTLLIAAVLLAAFALLLSLRGDT